MSLGPRLVIAGTHSGVGKTTVATGLMAALTNRGVATASAKVGPDFIDPSYHALATGRPPRNLDAWMCGTDAIVPLTARAGGGAEILVVEGVMGLFDGASDGSDASTAHVARLLDAPVVLVVDASAMSGSVAALVQGFRDFDARTRLAGVILNRVGSPGHETLLREALAPLGVPVVGALGRDSAFEWRDRHLGLVPVAEDPDKVRRSLVPLAAAVERSCDLTALVSIAHTAAPVAVRPLPPVRRVAHARVAVASGRTFSFMYRDNLEALELAGAELVPFDPLTDAVVPAGAHGLVAGGGFPEEFADALAANQPLLSDVRDKVAGGLVTWAECGGLLWLSRSLEGHRLAGVIDAEGVMSDRLSLGYRTASLRVDSPLGAAGTALRGHEFHYSTLTPAGDALALEGRFGRGVAGFATPTLLASYLHVHLATRPDLAERFVAASVA